ncbi:caspase domain-containing protein, partial [Sporodiniella umbellata]
SYIESLENRLKRMESLLGSIERSEQESVEKKPKETLKTREAPIEMPTSVEYSKKTSYLGSSSGYYLVRDILSTDKEVVEQMDQYPRISSVNGTENTGPITFRKINTADNDVMLVCDKTLAEHVGQVETDRSYIDRTIAPREFLVEIIQKFFQIEHSTLPVVEKEHFMDAFEGRTQPPPATILTYAIWAHTCSILSVHDPIFKKYDVEREHICNVLWTHITKIVKREYLTPRYATIQALVLICTYPNTYKTFHTNWMRGGMAIRMAQELGLHRTMEKLPLTKDMIEARKRLWYCVYITDRWNCAVMGRPLAIADADCDIELPDTEQDGKDHSVFVNFIKLSGILGEILSRICSPKAKARGPLMICYHVVLILLHRTFLVSNKDEILPELFILATDQCAASAKNIVDIARILSPTDIANFGWNFAGYAVFQACMIHLYNSTSPNPELAHLSKEYTQVCIEECVKPLIEDINCVQKNWLNILHCIMDLTGMNKDGPRLSAKNGSQHLADCPSKPGQPSAMSMHTIVSNWESNDAPLPAQEQDTFTLNNAWQSLFASAAAPFIGEEDNWQAMLASLFDEVPVQSNNPMDRNSYSEEERYEHNESYSHSYSESRQSFSHHSSFQNDDDKDPSFTEEDFQHPNPNYPQPPETEHNPGPHPDPTVDHEQLSDFELSNCEGKKRALLIGINYLGTKNQLDDMVILTDDQEEAKFSPTKANILSAMNWLVHDAEPNDSGHGGRVVDTSGDEDDGYDETIYPLDFQDFEGQSGQIIDDEMHEIMVKPLPKGCRLTAIFDSCHSGTVLDLPYIYSTKGQIKENNVFKHAGMGFLSAGMLYASGNREGALSSILSLGKEIMESHQVSQEVRERNASLADVIMFSGCKDDQTSADAKEAGRATGAMSYALTSKDNIQPFSSTNIYLKKKKKLHFEKSRINLTINS